jgi:DNA-directed RNA polymerase specialized sigma24 family protein
VYAEEPVGAEPDAAGIDTFSEHRDVLFAIAYRMLGSVTDAQDAVQDAWLRWSSVDRSAVRQARAYLIQTISRLCLDRLRSATSRREVYVGPWLPEPLATDPDASRPGRQVGAGGTVQGHDAAGEVAPADPSPAGRRDLRGQRGLVRPGAD